MQLPGKKQVTFNYFLNMFEAVPDQNYTSPDVHSIT